MSDATSQGEEAARRSGSEVDSGLFSRVQQLIQSARLTQDERIVVQTGDVASDVHTARKEFEMGRWEQAFRGVTRFAAAFDQKVAQWESRARQRESQKQKMSMLQIRKMQGEHSAVRTRVELTRAQIRRLRTGLDQLENAPRSQTAPTEADGAAPSPPPTAS